MNTIYELREISDYFRRSTEVNSISPEDTFGLISDILEYLTELERDIESLGIRKVYKNIADMLSDSVSPVGVNGKPLRLGQLVSIFDENTDQSENGNVYVWQDSYSADPWVQVGRIDGQSAKNINSIQNL